MTPILNWAAAILAVATTVGVLLSHDWRWSLAYLAVQYGSVFWLVQTHWPMPMAAAKLVTGWMACAILGITQSSIRSPADPETSWPQGFLFRIFAATFALIVSFALATLAAPWLGVDLPIAWGGLILIGMGLLHLGITAQPFRVIVGILTFLSGFESLYAAVEGSLLVAALLVVVNLGLALAGAYLLITSTVEETQ